MSDVALAEWLRRVPAKYMGFPRESSNLSGDAYFSFYPFPGLNLIFAAGSSTEPLQKAFSKPNAAVLGVCPRSS